MDYESLVAAALSCGATKATVIKQESIVLSAEFRKICENNGCGNYNRCWTCPPFDGEIEELMEKVRSFPHGLWFQTVGEIEDSFDFEGMGEVAKTHAQVCQNIKKNLLPLFSGRTSLLASGGCHLCEKCAKRDELPCRHPNDIIYSLEGSGVDVYNTTKSTELKYINGTNTVTYFGMLLFED